jgi:hypothetical protein
MWLTSSRYPTLSSLPAGFLGFAVPAPIIPAVRSEAFFHQAADDSVGFVYDLEPDSRRMIVAFAALKAENLPVRPFSFLAMLADVEVKAAFLRDHHEAWYHRGVAGIGGGIDEVAEFLRDFRRNAEEVVMIGGSTGAYGAALFGSLASCEVHAFSPQTFIDPELRREHSDKRFPNEVARLAPHMDMRYADLRPVVARSEASIHVYYAAGHRLDTLHAERLGDLDNVTLHPFEWDSHLLLRELRDRGWLDPFLKRLITGSER